MRMDIVTLSDKVKGFIAPPLHVPCEKEPRTAPVSTATLGQIEMHPI